MKKALVLCILAVMLSGCANNATTDETAAPAVSQTDALNTTVSDLPPTTTSSDQTSSSSSAATVTMSDKTTDATDTTTSRTRDKQTTTRKTVTSLSKTESTAKAETTDKTPETRAEKKASEKTVRSDSNTKVPDTTTSNTTAKPTNTATKKIATITTTAKPKQTSAAAKTKKVSTTAKSREEQYEEEFWEIVERKGLEDSDATCLETMVLDLKYSDTPPSYYEKTGKGLKHDGTDYGKAKAVYKWMRENGWGSCVYYSMETYFVCKGIGLECAYGFATDNGWYGHTYSVVKVDGIWYVMDTQGKTFLYNREHCIRMFDGNDKDIPKFKEDIWYDYDENGAYRDWSIE